MWTRKELKAKAKPAFKANYWKAVLVALVLSVVVGGFSVLSSSSGVTSLPAQITATETALNQASESTHDDATHSDQQGQPGKQGQPNKQDQADKQDHSPKADGSHSSNEKRASFADGVITLSYSDGSHNSSEDLNLDDLLNGGEENGANVAVSNDSSAFDAIALIIIFLTVFLALMVLIAIATVLYVFLLSPLEVGASRFFLRNLNQRAEVKELAYAYDNNYKEAVKTLFLRSLFICLWSLLFVIPGIYKTYQYRMIPYLLADDPTMTKDRAFAESKRMMDGQKWKAFVLDLSFIGWHILSALTLGLLGLFYVAPYQAQTNAALYESLRYGGSAPEAAPQAAQTAEPTAPTVPPVPAFAAAAPSSEEREAQPSEPAAENKPSPDSPTA